MTERIVVYYVVRLEIPLLHFQNDYSRRTSMTELLWPFMTEEAH